MCDICNDQHEICDGYHSWLFFLMFLVFFGRNVSGNVKLLIQNEVLLIQNDDYLYTIFL